MIESENLVTERRRRQTSRERAQRLKEKHQLIGDARGLGLMQALELVKDRKTKEPAPRRREGLRRDEEARRADRQGRPVRQLCAPGAADDYDQGQCG